MKILVDAMGGDHAPAETVKGAVNAAREYGIEAILVGREDEIHRELARQPTAGLKLSVAPAPEVIGPEEPPVAAVRRKKNSSLVVGLRLLRQGKADALVSAGNTGALMSGALLTLGRIPGIDRPALGTVLPAATGRGYLLLDMGANMDSTPVNLLQYAIMGSLYMEQVMGVERPRVALLNVGTEPSKGNEVVKLAYSLFKNSGLNFAGNLEARDMVLRGAADVVVCDGFIGNVLLKYAEGLGLAFLSGLKEAATRDPLSRLGALMLRPSLKGLARRWDYTEYGGAPLLGLNGVCIKCHGSSNARAIQNGIRVAAEFVTRDVVGKIGEIIAAQGGG